MSSGTFTMLKEAQPNSYILAEDWNNEFNNIITNCGVDGIGSASENTSNWTDILNPIGNSGVKNLPANLRDEIKELRYQIKTIIGEGFDWYDAPLTDLQKIFNFSLVTGGDLHDHTGTGDFGGGAILGADALLDGCITELKYADESIPSTAIIDQAIQNRCYEDGSITLDKIDTTNVPLGLICKYYNWIINGNILITENNTILITNPLTILNTTELFGIDLLKQFSNSTLEITCSSNFTANIDLQWGLALFIDNTLIASSLFTSFDAFISQNFSKIYYYTSPSVGEINISIRVGIIGSAGYKSIYIGNSIFGSYSPLNINIKEVKNL